MNIKTTGKQIFTDLGLAAIAIIIAIPLGRYAATAYENYQRPTASGDYPAHAAKQTYEVAVYGTSTCADCINTFAKFDPKACYKRCMEKINDKKECEEICYKKEE
ncbi:hypothetical protein [Rugamonas aquatica]|uniref:Uncharacterized protein n=1 Tax=Rugamonas aquatica TaxID=2743357 RepID=A0A6A7N8Y1_9BURK|nr:hypothetical protein [Rugamonas aquatica]MQA41499.1 hypothetical protein [Rugamonas aquatica]